MTTKATRRFSKKSGNIQAWHGKSAQNRHGDFQRHPKFLSPSWFVKHSSQYVVL